MLIQALSAHCQFYNSLERCTTFIQCVESSIKSKSISQTCKIVGVLPEVLQMLYTMIYCFTFVRKKYISESFYYLFRCFGSKETFSHFVEVLESSVKHRNTAHQYNRTHNVAYSESGDVTLCAGHVMCLLSHWCQLNCPQETSLCSTVKDACISLFMPNRSLHPQAADNNDFHVLPERHLAIMMESSSNKECLQRLISLVQRVQLSPEMKEKLKDASFINGRIVLLHTSLQLVVSVRWECHILHDYFEWVRNFVNENQGLRLELTERKPLSVCVHELVRLLCHRVKQEHARNGCTVRLEEYKSFTELLREK